MLDTKKVGMRIALLRKGNGMSQERLAELLGISPQAISKWENGHTLPETSLLPVLAQIFGCTIENIIMPAYSFDMQIDEEKTGLLEQQAEHIAKYVVKHMRGGQIPERVLGFDDDAIIEAVKRSNPNIGNCAVHRGKPEKKERYTDIYVTVSAPQREIKLLDRIYAKEDRELFGNSLFSKHSLLTPQVFLIDIPQRTILMEDLNDSSVQGFHFDEDSDSGCYIRAGYKRLMESAAKLHSTFWEDGEVFSQIGLDWRHESAENLLAHISGMEKDYLKYRKKEESGQIPKVWEVFENNIDLEMLDCYPHAIDLLRQKYTKLINTRLNARKNITLIHGDLHPGNIFISKTGDNAVKFIDFQAVRMGLCTEDLAMLVALHIEPDWKQAKPLIDHYYGCLCEKVKNYSYETFIDDYKIAVMENMFFPIRLMYQGIFDFSMRDKAIKI